MMMSDKRMIDVRLELTYVVINEEGEVTGRDAKQIPEIIKNVPIELFKGTIAVGRIITRLKFLGYSLRDAEVWFYSNDYKDFIYCGEDPIPEIVLAKESDLMNNCIRMKIKITRSKIDLAATGLIEKSKIDKMTNFPRVKERELGDIILKVKKWRDLYCGLLGIDGKRIKYSLEDAAKLVKLPKKTLDDYLQQLKMGKKLGFNFEENKHRKIGVLRDFIKEKLKEHKNEGINA